MTLSPSLRPSWWEEARQVLAGLLPGGAATVLDPVLEAALAGTGVALRHRDGARVTPLTGTGVPIEVRLGSGGAVGYTTVPGLRARYFGPRLRAERAAMEVVAGHLEPPCRDLLLADAARLVDACVPEPATVAPRTTQGTYLGVVHGGDGGLSGMRAYCSLRAVAGAPEAVAGVSEGFGHLCQLVEGLAVEPVMAAVQVDDPAVATHKLYVRLSGDGAAAALGRLAGRAVGPNDLEEAVAALGVAPAALGRGALVAIRAHGSGEGVDLALHLTRRVLGDGPTRWCRAERLAEGPAGSAALVAAMAVVEGRRATWEVNVLGLGVSAGGSVDRATAYLAPVPEPE